MMRVQHRDWFADVPNACAWVGDDDARVRVLRSDVDDEEQSLPKLEMSPSEGLDGPIGAHCVLTHLILAAVLGHVDGKRLSANATAHGSVE